MALEHAAARGVYELAPLVVHIQHPLLPIVRPHDGKFSLPPREVLVPLREQLRLQLDARGLRGHRAAPLPIRPHGRILRHDRGACVVQGTLVRALGGMRQQLQGAARGSEPPDSRDALEASNVTAAKDEFGVTVVSPGHGVQAEVGDGGHRGLDDVGGVDGGGGGAVAVLVHHIDLAAHSAADIDLGAFILLARARGVLHGLEALPPDGLLPVPLVVDLGDLPRLADRRGLHVERRLQHGCLDRRTLQLQPGDSWRGARRL
mmetsp:Transcript_60949/g.193329  ORF Transcript_60949/g.193329 Transcript_60949/m.193329 type:complete len:261 (+) Transcript_60949:562-1344(+)